MTVTAEMARTASPLERNACRNYFDSRELQRQKDADVREVIAKGKGGLLASRQSVATVTTVTTVAIVTIPLRNTRMKKMADMSNVVERLAIKH